MNIYSTFIFFGLLLLFSSTISAYPNKIYREKYPILRVIISKSSSSSSSMENDGSWEEKPFYIDGK
jgi:hypothetical protein